MKKEKSHAIYNAINERIKYKYRTHLKRIGQRDYKTIIDALKHIREFELFNDFVGFEKYSADVADKYIESLFRRKLSASYISNNIRVIKDFLRWLERQRGYRSKIDYNDIDYLNISRNQQNTAKAVEYQKSYKYEHILKTIRLMPMSTEKDKRDKAIISLQALCGLRISELRSIRMKNLIEENGQYFIYVSPKSMANVKFAKTREANFAALPDDIINNVLTWFNYLKSLDFRDSDPLFPVVDNRFTETNLLQQTMRKDGIKSDTTIRDIFKKAFEAAGFEYIKPHSFRKTVARHAEYQTPAYLNAVRQNLGHKNIDTTLSSYGQLSSAEQRRIISEVKIE